MYHEIIHRYFRKKSRKKTLTFDRQFDHIRELCFDGKDFDESDVVWLVLVVVVVAEELAV
jgi:hypothetical protein